MRGAGPLDVDLAGHLGDVGEDRDAVVADLDEAAVDGDRLLAALLRWTSDGADVERADEGRVAR